MKANRLDTGQAVDLQEKASSVTGGVKKERLIRMQIYTKNGER
jgi:hypothetical protein